jgi:hypothetical protein
MPRGRKCRGGGINLSAWRRRLTRRRGSNEILFAVSSAYNFYAKKVRK